MKRTAAKRGRGRPPIGDRVAVVLSPEQRAKVEKIAKREGLQGVAAAVRWCVDRAMP